MLLHGSANKISHKIGERPTLPMSSTLLQTTVPFRMATSRGQLCVVQRVLLGVEVMTSYLEKEARVKGHERTYFSA